MNKLIKAGIIGGIIYGVSELWFELGKGHVLGVLAAGENENVLPPSELLDSFSDDNRLRSKIVSKYGKYEKERILKKIES